MSNRLTFSLASLFLIFALTFSAAFVDEAHANADFEGKTISDKVFTEDIDVGTITLPTAKNADSYQLTDLPSGLTWNATARTITGDADDPSGRSVYTYTAVDDNGSNATLTFTIEVKANKAPKFATGAEIKDLVLKIGIDAEPLVDFPTATDPDAGDELTYTLTGELPSGVQFDPFQQRFVGRPTAPNTSSVEYNYIATDRDSNTDTLTFNITAVEANAKPTFGTGATRESIANMTVKVDEAIKDTFLPEATDENTGDELTYTLSGTLPAGLEYIQSARLLRGTPTAVKAETTHTYTVTDPDGNTDELTFKITVRADPVFADSASIRDYTFVVGTEVDAGPFPTATDADDDIDAYSISPQPPDGVTFVASLRKLLGNPTATQKATKYTYTVTDEAGGTDKLEFMITVADEAPTDTTAPTVTITGAPTTAITAATTVTLTFDEALKADPTVAGVPDGATAKYTATVAKATTPANTYEVTITPTAAADLTADVAETAVTFTVSAMDTSDNALAAGNTFMVTLAARTAPADETPPTVTITGAPTTAITAATTVTLTFDEALKADPTVAGVPDGATAKYTATVAKATTPANTYEVTITPTAAADLTADVAETAVTFTVSAMDTSDNALAAGNTFMVTLAARMAPTGLGNNAPTFPAGSTIADIVIWKGTAHTSPVLPKATDDEGDTLKPYAVMPELPDGLRLVADDAQDRFITGTATAMSKKTKYEFIAEDSGGLKTKLAFNITVLDPIKPTAPTGVTAMESGSDATPRVLNDNTVMVKWTTPVDDTVTTHTAAEKAPDFGAAISDYMVYVTDASGTTIPHAVGKKDATSFTTPVLPIGTYDIEVAAVNSVDTGKKSTKVSVLVANVPGQPTNLSAALVPNTKTVTLNWLAPSSDGGASITSYMIYVIDNLGTGRVRGISTTTDVTTVTTPALDPGQYIFRVAAMNVDGLGPQSANTTPPTVVPTQPVDPTNNPPTFGNESIANITATVGMAIEGTTLPAATDVDGDIITYSLSPIPTLIGLSFNPTTRFLSGTPTASTNGVRTYTYTARDTKGGTAALNFTIQVMSPTPALPAIVLPAGIPDVGGSFTAMTAGRVIGETTLSGSIAANNFGVVLADDLPDLEVFFRQKGTIVLTDNVSPAGENLGTRVVLISEILWGYDAGEPAGMQNRRQFIELYNTGKTGSVNVTGWKLVFTLHRPAPPNVVDRVSNAGTAVDTGWFMDIGQSGVLTGTTLAGATALGGTGVPVDIISAYRNINYNAVQGGGDRLKADHVRWGHQKGSWKATTRITTQVGIKASPGARHFVELGPLTKTGVSRSPFIINEIGNATGGANDWIELRNVTDSVQSLKNRQLSVVTANKKDTVLFHFHDQDYKVPAKGVILIASSDPSTNDLAGGNNAAKGDLDEVLEGATHLYIVPTKGVSVGADGGKFNIPDSGKTLLILRNNHEGKHLGTGNHIADWIGTLSIQDTARGTNLWPLYVWGGPHGNVVKNGDEDFRAGKVYQRNNTNADGKEAIEIRGYTGIGYDRFADANGENGGTPGYDNGALKHKYSDFSGQISVSEIMLVTEEEGAAGRVPRATRLPQWIELYNNSMTQAVTISNWHLEIQNDDTEGFLGNLHGTLRLPGIMIPPNQTVLIVSSAGLNSGNFPPQRTVNVFLNGTWRRELGLVNRGDEILNPAGFYVELRDHENRPVDEIGNLGVSRRTGTGRADNFGESWEIPSMHSDDGHRTSLIRVYNNGSAENGLMQDSWNRAADTNFRHVPSLTYYGNHRDYGTPGYRGGGALPVSLSKFRPERLDTGEVVIRWITESELNNAGFNILRSDKRDGEFTQVNAQLIKGHGTTSERHTYEWKDTSAKPNVVYYYQIQDVSIDGQVQTLRFSRLKGNVSAVDKVTTTWGELKALQ